MNYLILTLLSLFLLFQSCAGGSETENATEVGISTPKEVKQEKASTPDAFDATFADGMTEAVFQYYLKLRTALVNSDEATAKAAAGNLAERLGEDNEAVRSLANEVANAEDIEAVRSAFYTLSTELEPLFTEGISSGVIYKQYCPMAFSGEGATWFSDADQIRNPYFGDRMLKCGKIVAEITAP